MDRCENILNNPKKGKKMQKIKQKQRLMLSIATAVLLTACGNNSGGMVTSNEESKEPTLQLQKGELIGANDEITYFCGDNISQIDENKSFECSSMPITFSIEGVEIATLKEIPSNRKVYMSDLLALPKSDVNSSSSSISQKMSTKESEKLNQILIALEKLRPIRNNITDTLTDTQAVQMTIDSIVLDDSEPLTQSLELMSEGEYNSTIVWESSNQNILTNEGELTQPTALEGETKVSLVALVSRGEVRERVVFEFIVGVDEGGVL